MRTKKIDDQILHEQKKREEEEKKKREEERKKQEEEREREVERKKKEEVAAALAAARDKVRRRGGLRPCMFTVNEQCMCLLTLTFVFCPHILQWTPLGFMMRDPDTMDEISKERFEGTVLKAINKHPRRTVKKELEEVEMSTNDSMADSGETLLTEVQTSTLCWLDLIFSRTKLDVFVVAGETKGRENRNRRKGACGRRRRGGGKAGAEKGKRGGSGEGSGT